MTQRTSIFLMANLGSEVSKIISAKEKNDIIMLDLASTKAKSILTELAQKPETKNNQEISILKDIVFDLMNKVSVYSISPKHLKSYFLPFTMRLMRV